MRRLLLVVLAAALLPRPLLAGPSFKKVFIVVLENESPGKALAQPFLAQLAKTGAYFKAFRAETRPSQPNYIALVAGTYAGAKTNKPVALDLTHVGDLLEAQGKTWKAYAEGYPGSCFLGASAGAYARKHVPFLSFTNVQKDPKRCANVVEAGGLAADAAAGALPDFSLYVPDMDNSGHDTGVAFADAWLKKTFEARLADPAFMKDLLFVVTFDEGDHLDSSNSVYTAFLGDAVAVGAESSEPYDHYSLLRTVEDALGLGTLGRSDAAAKPIDGVWK